MEKHDLRDLGMHTNHVEESRRVGTKEFGGWSMKRELRCETCDYRIRWRNARNSGQVTMVKGMG